MHKKLIFQQFIQSKWSLLIYDGDKAIFCSQASGLKPIVSYLKKFRKKYKKVVIYDKIVGRAAALLFVLLKPSKVYTPLASQGGVFVLRKYRISYKADQQVKYLMGLASQQMCQWEKLAQKRTPQTFWNLVKKL